MADTRLGLYTAGQGRVVPIDHTGPSSYTTGGETYGNQNSQTGPSKSGNYFVYAYPSNQKQFKLVWVTATTGIPTTTQVTAAVDLSAETVRLLVIGR
jgi:hypothetical protein